ncbi:MAG: glycerol-3-phosphate dehydrogenase [Alphaproteobacteria bacterium]|nr:glycerol-3-phosphate dehydrogenase [Alphaproteobacteria bacterium]
MAGEGSLGAPMRRPLAWQDPDFTDRAKVEAECRRVFDICHGCRRCFNLCDSFPRLFDLIDAAPSGELEDVSDKDFKRVTDACTLCDMCFMTKCPYVPPHEFDLDFPHLMLRYRAMELKEKQVPLAARELTETDRNARLAAPMAPLANWAMDTKNKPVRTLMEKATGVDREAALPKFHGKTFAAAAAADPVEVNREAPAFGRKAVLYATCYGNYHNPQIGFATRAVLARNGVETEIVYPTCCGMPKFEHGDLASVAKRARKVAGEMRPWIEKGYAVIALMPSCALMLKFEWPLVLPDDADVKRLSEATLDVTEYVVDIALKEGLAEGLSSLDGGVAMHLACHARAQNMGQKAVEMLRLIPEADLQVIERCSGHGGSWGIMKENFETALKVGKPVARQAANGKKTHVASECPLAGQHILQGMARLDGETVPDRAFHPIELFARAYGVSAP